MLPGHIKTVLLDLDETLLDDARGMRAAVISVATRLAARHPTVDAERLASAYINDSDQFWIQLSTSMDGRDGRALRVAVWGQVLATCGLGGVVDPEDAVDLYAPARRESYALFDDVLPFLEVASTRWKLAVLTNGAGDTQREKLAVTGLTRYLANIFVSGEIGVAKPDAGAFRHALEAIKADPATTAHVGDSLRLDIEGALASDLLPVWLRRTPDDAVTPPGVMTIASLADLVER